MIQTFLFLARRNNITPSYSSIFSTDRVCVTHNKICKSFVINQFVHHFSWAKYQFLIILSTPNLVNTINSHENSFLCIYLKTVAQWKKGSRRSKSSIYFILFAANFAKTFTLSINAFLHNWNQERSQKRKNSRSSIYHILQNLVQKIHLVRINILITENSGQSLLVK